MQAVSTWLAHVVPELSSDREMTEDLFTNTIQVL